MKKIKNKKENIFSRLLPFGFVIVGIIVLIISLCLIFGGKKSMNEENHIPDPNDPNYKSVKLPFNKQDVMTLIYQKKEIENNNESWSVKDASLLAHTEDNSKYLIRYKKLNSDGTVEEYESIITINNDEKNIDLPGWPIDSKDVDTYNFIYYTEDSDGYDPVNQQYDNSELIENIDE